MKGILSSGEGYCCAAEIFHQLRPFESPITLYDCTFSGHVLTDQEYEGALGHLEFAFRYHVHRSQHF